MALAVAVATGMKRTLEKHPSEPSRALRARELQNPADLEERQLENIVGGMAMAGGVSQPRVLLMEGEAVKPEQAGKIVHGLRLPAFARRLTATRLKGICHLRAELAHGAFQGPDLVPRRIVSGLLAPHPVRSRAIHCFCHSCACRLADATAVQLTRNPTGLASALRIWQRLPPRSAASGGLNCIRRSNQRIIQLKPMGRMWSGRPVGIMPISWRLRWRADFLAIVVVILCYPS
jgi:hypothetical protein